MAIVVEMKIRISLRKRWFQKLLALYVIVWAILPVVQYGTINRLSVATAAMIWFVMAMSNCIINHKTLSEKVFAAVILFSVLTILVGVICGEGLFETVISRLQSIIFLLLLCIGVYYLETEPEFLINATKIVIPITLVVAVLTFRQAQLTPGMSRMMVWDAEIAQEYASQGVGGYGLIYSSVFYACCLLYMISVNVIKKKVWSILAVVLLAVTVFTSGFLIASIMMATSIFVFVFGLYKKNDFVRVMGNILLIVLVLYLLGQVVIVNNGDKLIKLFDETLYETKIKEIVLLFQEEQNVGHLEGRTSRYMESLIAVLKYPIFGAKIVNQMDAVGGHSTLLDVFATYGLLISYGYYYAIYKVFKRITQYRVEKGLMCVFGTLLLINGCFNTFTYEHGVAFFVVFPATILLRMKDRKNESYMDNALGNV